MTTNTDLFLNDINNISAVYGREYSDAGIQNILSFMLTQEGPGGNASNRFRSKLNTFNSTTTPDYDSFLKNYLTNILGYDSSYTPTADQLDLNNVNSPLFSYFSIFKVALRQSSDIGQLVDIDEAAQFKAMFSDFLKNSGFGQLLTDSTDSRSVTLNGKNYTVTADNNFRNLTNYYLNYLSTTAVVQTSSSSIVNLLTNTSGTGATYIQSYQRIYEAFNGPIGTLSSNSADWTVEQQVFVQRLTEFYNSELQKTSTTANPSGFFNTSQALGDFYTYSQNLYYNPQFTPNALSYNANGTIILDEVLKALISMIGTIQNVAATQANTLNFLSQWQAAYTNKLNQIHIFAQGDGTALGTFNNDFPYQNGNWDQVGAQATRNALNNINQNYISKLQANQQTISDNAKSLQTNVNQSNDAANQQASVADSLLQTMSTILSAIFR